MWALCVILWSYLDNCWQAQGCANKKCIVAYLSVSIAIWCKVCQERYFFTAFLEI